MAKSTSSPALQRRQSDIVEMLDGGSSIDLSELKLASTEVKIWCDRVDDFSSQYGNELSISYTMSNLGGPSSIYSQYGDFTQAAVMRTYGQWWMKCSSAAKHFSRSRGSFLSQDFVELSFEYSVIPTSIEVFETYNPGAVVRIFAGDKLGPRLTRWYILWEGKPQVPPQAARIFNPQPIRRCPFFASHIRIEFHHSHLSYYTELDAVRLTGHLPPNYIFPDESLSDHMHPPIISRHFPFNCSLLLKSTEKRIEDETEEEVDCGSSVDAPIITNRIPDESNLLLQNDQNWCKSEISSQNWSNSEAYSCAFFRLPMEILKIIFDYLDLKSLCNLSSTCRFFYQHCNDETQFYDLDLQPYWHLITDDILFIMSQKFKCFRRVDLSWCNNLSSTAILGFLSEPRLLLTSLRLNCCPFVDYYSLESIASQCPYLKELRLQSCQRANGSSFSCLSALKELKVLDLYRTLVNTDSLVKIMRSCHKLEHINLGSCTNNDDCNRVVAEMARSCPNLKSVDLWRSKGLTYAGLSALVRGCHFLEELDLGWCNQLKSTDGCFREIAEHCANLKKLFVTANRGLCDADLDLLSNNCRHLEQLDVLGTREITNASVLRLLDRCHSLELLDLSFCAGIDYHSLEPALASHPKVDIKRSFQGSTQAEEYLDRPAQFQ